MTPIKILTAPRDFRRPAIAGRSWSIVTTLGMTEIVSYGVLVYAFGVLLAPMSDDLGYSAVTLTGAFSLAILVSGLAAPVVGRLLDRHHPRWLMGGGSALAACLVFAWSRSVTLWEIYVVFAGLGVAMALVLYEPAFTVVATRIPERRDAALSSLTLMGAFASFTFSPLAERLAGAHGWRTTLVVLALVLGVVTVPLHLWGLRGAPPGPPPSRDDRSGGGRDLIRERRFWLLAGAFALPAFASMALTVQLVGLLVAGGISGQRAALLAGIVSIAQIPGRLAYPSIVRRVGAGRALVGVQALAAVAIAMLIPGGAPSAIGFAILYGIANGMTALLRASVVADHYGVRRYGEVAGALNAAVLAARAAAPLGAGFVALLPGRHVTLLVVLAAGLLVSARLAQAASAPARRRCGCAVLCSAAART